MDRAGKLYFSGIAGSGMSAIALFMSDRGFAVRGSDRLFDVNSAHMLINIMRSRGIEIIPQDGKGIDSTVTTAVFSTAVEEDSPDFVKARALQIPIITRPEFLAGLVKQFRTLAVAGTSGKSTVSGMLAYLMRGLGLEPNFIGGGRVRQFRSAINQGNSLSGRSDRLVIEACESDGSIVNYCPESTIILNLDLDHHNIEETRALFYRLIENTSKRVIINQDDKNLSAMLRDGFVTFSLNEESLYRPDNYYLSGLYSDFSIGGIRFHLPLPGKYNILNAVACIAYLAEEGIAMQDIADVMAGFNGIERRFEIHLNDNRGLVIDDYAHNPHKISSMMKAASALRRSICYVFQPHGYGPTRLMKEGYIKAFIEGLRDEDHLILLPIYYAGGTASKDISSNDIVQGVVRGARSAEAMLSRGEIFSRIGKFKNFVIFGARDDSLSEFAASIGNALK